MSPPATAWRSPVSIFTGLLPGQLLRRPGTSARPTWSDDEILAYHASGDVGYTRVVALYLAPFAGIAFLWFLAAFRDRVSKLAGTENMMLSTVQILSGSIYVAMQFSAAASIVTVVLTLDAGTPTPWSPSRRYDLSSCSVTRSWSSLHCVQQPCS
jgi:hypothetical protein